MWQHHARRAALSAVAAARSSSAIVSLLLMLPDAISRISSVYNCYTSLFQYLPFSCRVASARCVFEVGAADLATFRHACTSKMNTGFRFVFEEKGVGQIWMVKPVSRFGDEGGPQNQKVKMIQYSDSVL
jgi:hypothetical protein